MLSPGDELWFAEREMPAPGKRRHQRWTIVSRHRCSGIVSASARSTHRRLFSDAALRTKLEELIAQLRGKLEVHGRRRLPHLLLQHPLERFGVHDRVAACRLGDLALLALRASVRDAGDEPNLVDALADGRWRDLVHAVVLDLHLAPARRLLDAALHRTGDAIRVENG